MQEITIDEHKLIPDKISRHYEKYFSGDRPFISQIRRYFRAADKQGDEKVRKKMKRQETLHQLCIKMILDEFPADREYIVNALSKDGLASPGEMLRCNIYPFYFEEWVLDLFKKAQTAQ